MKIYQKFWAPTKIWQVKTRYVTFLLLISTTRFCTLYSSIMIHFINMSLIWSWHFALFVGILSGRRSNSFITNWFYSELFFSKCGVSKHLLSECSRRRRLLYIGAIVLLRCWVHDRSWSLCVTSTSTTACCLIFKIQFWLELNDLSCAGVSLVLGHVDELTNEASRAVAWCRRWE